MLLARPRILAALAVLLAPLLLIALSWLGELRRARDIGPLMAEVAAQHSLPLPLLKAVVWRESDFEIRAVGGAGERGLMQVTAGAAQDWARVHRIRSFRETDLFDPRTNLEVGTWYLARAIRRWAEEGADRPEVFGLAEYNAGITRARRWATHTPGLRAREFLEAIDFPTTQAYIRSILRRAELYATGRDPGPGEWVGRRLALQKEKWIRKQKESL
jgi:soluble lytic murein transglycosylase